MSLNGSRCMAFARTIVAAFVVSVVALGATSASAMSHGTTRLWMATYRGAGGVNAAEDMAVSPDGSEVFVTGGSQSIRGNDDLSDYVTIAYSSATGLPLWQARYDGPAGGRNYATALAVSPDGSKVFVTGSSEEGPTTTYYATVAYDASTGAQLWAARYGRINGLPRSLAVSPDGSALYVTGQAVVHATSYWDMVTVAYDTGTGSQLWRARYNGPANRDDAAYSVAVSPDGTRVFVGGYITELFGTTMYDAYATIAYDAASGKRVWVSRYRGRDHQDAGVSALAMSPNGSTVFVTGGDEGYSGTTIAYAADDGSKRWVAHAGLIPTAIAVGPGGRRVYVTGYIYSTDYMTVAYGAGKGTQHWTAEYDGPGHGEDSARAIAVSPDGRSVYVTGQSQGSPKTGFDYATVAYSAATGGRRWVARYSPHLSIPGWDYALRVATSPDGSTVFVTGNSERRGVERDNIVTVAYAAHAG